MKKLLLSLALVGFQVSAMEFNQESNSLYDAITNDDIERVEQLIAQGANVNAREPITQGNVPLCLALDSVDILELLLKSGAQPNAQVFCENAPWWVKGDTLLMKATHDGNKDAIKMLLTYGANPLIKNQRGQTAVDIVKRLLSQQNGIPKFLRSNFVSTYTAILAMYDDYLIHYTNKKTYKELLLTQYSNSSPAEFKKLPRDIIKHIFWILTGLLCSQLTEFKPKQ